MAGSHLKIQLGVSFAAAVIIAGILFLFRKPDAAVPLQTTPVSPSTARPERSLRPKSLLLKADTPSAATPSPDPASPVTEYLKTQAYSTMTPLEINELLNLLTLGEGKVFESNKSNFVTTLATFEKAHPERLRPLDRLEGVYRSDFVDSVPRGDEEGYNVVLRFDKSTLTAEIVQNSQVYYQHTYQDLKNQLMTGKSPDLPPNLFIELPAKPEYGYLHPIYLEVMIGADLQSLIAVMYNTNQFLQSADYKHAENLIFSKVE